MSKLSKSTQLIIAIGVFIVILISMGVVWQKQLVAQEEVRHELSLVQKVLAKVKTPATELEANINQARSELRSAEAGFPVEDKFIEIADRLIDLADSSQVEVVAMSANMMDADTVEKKLGIAGYEAMSFDIGVTGQVAATQSFLVKVSNDFVTSGLSTVKIQKPECNEETDTARILIHILNRGGGS